MGYPEPPLVGDEHSTLVGSLERQRATFWWKCEGLRDEQLRRGIGSSDLTLARLVKHLAYMEDLNFTQVLGGRTLPAPWIDVDAEHRSEWAFASADSDSVSDLHALWHGAVERSRGTLTDVLRGADPGVTYDHRPGRPVAVRRLLVDLIEEYARHTGHADLLREAIDGRVGEDPPGPSYEFVL